MDFQAGIGVPLKSAVCLLCSCKAFQKDALVESSRESLSSSLPGSVMTAVTALKSRSCTDICGAHALIKLIRAWC